ncbi:MAG TPA: topoisomerase C-terminal repeat-containing protein, partial [Pararhizobium sp.]|nr:topoisomerase C-terminal repeat-containing protein [Pararhizobium sp.]
YGPFLLHDGSYANLDSVEDVFSIGLNRAVTVIAEKKAKGPGRRNTPAALKELGEHPDGGAITVRDGRYGPYVNWGKINATLPKDKDPQSVTLDEALALIASKAGKNGAAKGGKKPAAKSKAKPAKGKKASSSKKAVETPVEG